VPAADGWALAGADVGAPTTAGVEVVSGGGALGAAAAVEAVALGAMSGVLEE